MLTELFVYTLHFCNDIVINYSYNFDYFFQSLQTEIDNHEPRIVYVCENGNKLVSENHEDSPKFKRLNSELQCIWMELKNAIQFRRIKLDESEKAQQV